MKYFNYISGLTMTNRHFDRLFGGGPRKPESRITQREMDLARSIQKVTEEVMLRITRYVHTKTNMKNLCLAGGVALNCVANGKILKDNTFENMWIQPAAGDAGGALGVALFIAVPLPVSGVYTGSLGSFVLGLSRKQYYRAVILGVLIAAILVTAITLGGISLFT